MRGFVVTDFIFGLHDGLAALKAGQDLEMPFQMIWHGCLAEALAAGQLPMSRVDDAVLRQLRQRLRLNRARYTPQLRRCSQHLQLARQAARESIVLLRNAAPEGEAPLLPFGPLGSLAVIGELAARANLGDRGSSDTRPPRGAVVTPLQGLRDARPVCRCTTTPLAIPTLLLRWRHAVTPQWCSACARANLTALWVSIDRPKRWQLPIYRTLSA